MYQWETTRTGYRQLSGRRCILRTRFPSMEYAVDAIVKATCPQCGDVELEPADLVLRICSIADACTYHFSCPRCEKIVVKPAADGRVVTLLQSVGVPTVSWELPAELSETHEGPPLTIDDLIDLRLLLDRPDWAEQLATT